MNLHTRRNFLKTTSAAMAATAWQLNAARADGVNYRQLTSQERLGPVEIVAQVDDVPVFTEGPAVDHHGNVFFTNVPRSKILKWSPETEQLTTFNDDSHETNGLLFTPDGHLLCCEGGARRVTRRDISSGKVEVLADKFEGRPFAKPNDLCLDQQGRIYFTSRTSTDDPPGENPKAVYRIDPNGDVTQVLAWPDVHMPNGIVLSPDESRLYLIEAHPDAAHHRDIRVYDVDAQGDLKNGRVLIDFYPGRSGDGMCIDDQGNLYVAAGLHALRGTSETLDTRPGIHVISPDGQLIAYRETPVDTITNCTLTQYESRQLLYITCGNLLLRIQVNP